MKYRLMTTACKGKYHRWSYPVKMPGLRVGKDGVRQSRAQASTGANCGQGEELE
jgi:hypothetical protein